MKTRTLAIIVVTVLVSEARAAIAQDLFNEMRRLGLKSALVVASEAIDEHPVWSPNGDALAANVDGR